MQSEATLHFFEGHQIFEMNFWFKNEQKKHLVTMKDAALTQSCVSPNEMITLLNKLLSWTYIFNKI